MKAITLSDQMFSLSVKQKFGKPNQLGFMTLGITELGDYNLYAGIYRIRRSSNYKRNERNTMLGFMTLGYNLLGTSYKIKNTGNYKSYNVSKTVFYRPTNPQTGPQQAWRNYFAIVLSSWQSLSENDKNVWRKQRYPAHMSGWNRYAKMHLKAKDL